MSVVVNIFLLIYNIVICIVVHYNEIDANLIGFSALSGTITIPLLLYFFYDATMKNIFIKSMEFLFVYSLILISISLFIHLIKTENKKKYKDWSTPNVKDIYLGADPYYGQR